MTGQNNSSIALNLTHKGSIEDAAGNPLSTSTFAGQATTDQLASVRPTALPVSSPLHSLNARSASPGEITHVVLIISTEQGAWWETLLGTEPSRKRLAPVMPLLPTMIRSASLSSATSRIASAGSPCRG
jgi:hypothetical protein